VLVYDVRTRRVVRAPAAEVVVETEQDPRSVDRWSLSTLVDMNQGIKTVLSGDAS
jgi:hypothetical protein